MGRSLLRLPRIKFILLLLLIAVTQHSFAEQFQRFGDFEIHYVVFNTQYLQGDIAQRYNIERANNIALVNISVLKVAKDGSSEPVEADVVGTASNLMQQRQVLPFRTIKESDAVYSLADLRISDREILRFDISVKPKGSRESYSLRFNQMTYIDRD